MGKKIADINKAKCVACGECRLVCPRGAIEIYKGCFAEVMSKICIGCGLCAKNCPAGSILIKERK